MTVELNLGVVTEGANRELTTSSSTSAGSALGAVNTDLRLLLRVVLDDFTPVCRTSSLGRLNEGNLRPALFRFHRDFLAEGGGEEGSEYPGAGRTDGGSGCGDWYWSPSSSS